MNKQALILTTYSKKKVVRSDDPSPRKMTQILELESKGVEASILNIRRHKMKICFQERGTGFQKRNCKIKKMHS